MPRVSVIMPAYNAGEYIESAVSSVLAQSFSDWELIIVDDGSTDDTAEKADALAARDGRVRVLHRQNAGVSVSRNLGITQARGESLAFLDADDAFEPEFLETLISAMDSRGADCAACGHLRVYPGGQTEPEPFPLDAGLYSGKALSDGVVLPLLADRLSAGLFNGFIWRFIFSRETVVKNSVSFSGAYLEDELFLIEYFCHPGRLVVCDGLLYRYYQNPASVTRSYLPGYTDTFFASLAAKRALVSRFGIKVPGDWEKNACWAGLLMAIGNIFAPGSGLSFLQKRRALARLRDYPDFDAAVKGYVPRGMNRRKALVAALYRRRLYFTLSLLYTVKNRG